MRYTLSKIAICYFLLIGQVGATEVVNDGDVDLKIQFELVDGLILIPLTVDGVEGVYILDSGAPSLVLNRNIEGYTAIFTAVGKEIPAQETEVDNIQFGPILIEQSQAWEMDLHFVEQLLGRPISGLVGADFLAQHDIVIDYRFKEISFIAADYDGQFLSSSTVVVPVPFEIYNDNLPVVTVSIEGELRRMVFDTGAGISVLHEEEEKISEIESYLIAHKHLTIKDAQFLHADLSALRDKEGRSLDGILSATSLNANKMLISFNKKTIYLFYDQIDLAFASK